MLLMLKFGVDNTYQKHGSACVIRTWPRRNVIVTTIFGNYAYRIRIRPHLKLLLLVFKLEISGILLSNASTWTTALFTRQLPLYQSQKLSQVTFAVIKWKNAHFSHLAFEALVWRLSDARLKSMTLSIMAVVGRATLDAERQNPRSHQSYHRWISAGWRARSAGVSGARSELCYSCHRRIVQRRVTSHQDISHGVRS